MTENKNLKIIESEAFRKLKALAYADYNTQPGSLGRKDDPGMGSYIVNDMTDSTSIREIEELWKKRKKKKYKKKPGRQKIDPPELSRSML